MKRAHEPLCLSTDEMAFFLFVGALYPHPESPLYFLEQVRLQPNLVANTAQALGARELLGPSGTQPIPWVNERLVPVSECVGRIVILDSKRSTQQHFYVGPKEWAVLYRRNNNGYWFSAPTTIPEIAELLYDVVAQHSSLTNTQPIGPLHLSASDYLVFSVFARDIRATQRAAEISPPAMSVDEVLSYFDEPETKKVRTPNDATWEASIQSLVRQGLLEGYADGYKLTKSCHALATGIVANHNITIMRMDFLDDQWLLRELHLYPTKDGLYRFAMVPDGAVAIEELQTTSLREAVISVIDHLPNILDVAVPPAMKTFQALSRNRTPA